MPTPESSRPGAARLRGRAALGRLAVVLLVSVAAAASWLGASRGLAQQDGSRVPRHASAALENAARHIMSLSAKTDGVVLAAQGTQEGHWRFVNKAGEMFTVGTPDEMRRVISVLYPEAKANARVSLYMTEDTVFRHGPALKSLPASAGLNVVVGGASYRLLRRSDPAGERLLAEVRSNLAVEMRDQKLFGEVLWQLARPLNQARVRVLALEPGGPRALAASPRIDPAAKRALIDAIDPVSLAPAMGSVPGQMLLVVGRVERDLLYVRPSSGPEHTLLLNDLFKAAGDADVNLIVLQTASTPRQPSGPNGLWPSAQDGEKALQRAQLADLLNGLAARRIAVVASAADRRTVLATLASDLPGAARPPGDRLSGIVADITARAVVIGVQANLLSAEHQRELDQRFLPRIPAALQVGYLVLVVLGLIGMPVARTWWARFWPPEVAAEYAGRSGYWAACAVRGLAFLVLFLPVTAAAAAPYNLARQIGEAVQVLVRGWRRLGGRGAKREAGAPPPLPRKGGRDALDPTRMRERAPNR